MSGAKTVIICGAGWAGMHAAQILQRDGYKVKVLERENHPGGRVATENLDGFLIDYGFQVINPAYAELKESRALDEIDFYKLPKAIDIRIGMETIRIGDPRQRFSYLKGALNRATGTIGEKLKFLRYLRRETEDISFGQALCETGDFFNNVLSPFLTGVFLSDPEEVSNRMARELIHWFIKGNPGVPAGGVGSVSQALSRNLDIEYGVEVTGIHSKSVETSKGNFQADYVIAALDPLSSAQILKLPLPKMNRSKSWYFKIAEDEIDSDVLRVGGLGPVINSLVISNIVPSYAPAASALLVATTLGDGTEAEVRAHLSYLWEITDENWTLLKCIDIPNSLPNHSPGKDLVIENVLVNGVYVAGDWMATPSQQGALLSGRRAANAIIADQ